MARKLAIVAGVVVVVLVVFGLVVRRMVDPEVVRAAVEQQASAALGQPVKVGAVDWALSARPRIVLTNVQVGSPAAIALNRVEVSTGLRALLSKRVERGGVVISGSRISLPLPFALGGTTGRSSTPTSDAAAGLTFASIDRISLSDIDLAVGNAHLKLDLESSLSGDRLVVSRVRLRSDRTSLDGTGEVTSLAARKSSFTVTGDPLDLDELLTIASGVTGSTSGGATAPAAVPATSSPIDLRMEIKSPKGRLLGIDFANLTTTLAVTRDGLALEPFSVGLFDGTLAGRLGVDTDREPSEMTLAATVEAIDVAKAAAFAGSSGVMTGRLDGRLELRAAGGAPDIVFRTANGRATLTIKDGSMPGLDLVGPVILAFGKPDPGKATERSSTFSTLGGTFALSGGLLRSDDLSMSSRDLDMKGRGTLRVAGAVVDLKADLLLSEALSSQAGRDLQKYAHDGSRVVVPATITGSLASPKVSIDLAAAAGRAIRNAAEDEVKKGLGRLLKH